MEPEAGLAAGRRAGVAGRGGSQRPSQARAGGSDSVSDRAAAGEPPDSARQPGFARRTRASSWKTARTCWRTSAAGTAPSSTASASQRKTLENTDRVEFGAQDSYQLAVRAGRRGTQAADGAGGRRRAGGRAAGSGQQPGEVAGHPGSGAHAAELVLHRRGAGQRGGYGADHYRRGARISAAARRCGRAAGDPGGAQPARAELARDRSARAARGDPARAGASPRTAVDELRAAGRGGDAAARTASPTWNCAA